MQQNKIILDNLIPKIEKGEEISPFLFLSPNKELLSLEVNNLALDLLKYFNIPSNYLFTLKDKGEKIKISEIKEFLLPMLLSTPYKIQIFFIENISAMTIGAANSSLKRFEEPWKTNIIFLSDSSQGNILDTVLSRVQIQNLWWYWASKRDEFYLSIISSYLKDNSEEIISYFFRNKLEKQDYIKFLENLIIYAKENFVFIDYLDEVNDDINMISTNNVNAKYVVDKWILRINNIYEKFDK